MKIPAAATLILLALPTLAHAHTGHGDASGFSHGVFHPLLGLDHLLAMVAIGLWAAQLGGRALWAVPVTFVGAMIAAAFLGMQGFAIPLVEPAILASVIILGLLISLAVRVPLPATLILVATFGLFHGYAHGTEMPFSASGFAYASGFALATAALHLAGIGVGIAIQHLATAPWIRLAGATIALAGAVTIFL